ncbi:DddA-like double-stranded DNA deaminase toxin [Kribbella sp. NPDC059898]|uniref:DddA-like double-stranded DNA deaminase toxin n=1 Tax=Kribbella sp. NPDC059898 TaxID=3346995 RepID=UPI0036477ACD
MPSELQRVAQGLLSALDEIPLVVTYLHDSARKYREAAAWVGGLTNNSQARMAAAQLDEAARRCEEAAHYLSLAPPKARSWVEQMVSGERIAEPCPADALPPAGGGGSHPATDSRRAGGGRDDDWDPAVREIFQRLPVRARKDKTRGVWVDPDGTEHDLNSGVDEYTGDAERLIVEEDLDIAPGDVTLGSHVEVKFAMFMRRNGLSNETIIINNRPCEGPYSCDENLEKFLPDGAKLTVWGPNNFKKTYAEPPSEEPPA